MLWPRRDRRRSGRAADDGRTRTNAGTRRTVCPARARSGRPRGDRLYVQSLASSVLGFGLAAQSRSKPACAADRFCLAWAQRCCAPTVLIAAGLGFLLWADGYREREKIDEAFGVFGIVAAHGEAGEVGAIEGERRDAPGDGERAFPKLEADGTGDALLRDAEESVERGAQGREPQTVIYEFGVAQREGLLKVGGFTIDSKGFEFAMRGDQQSAAGSFVGAARFHADQAIFDYVGAADAVLCGNFVERVPQFVVIDFGAVHGYGQACFEADFDFGGFVRGFFRGNDPLPHGFVRGIGWIFQLAAFVAEV